MRRMRIPGVRRRPVRAVASDRGSVNGCRRPDADPAPANLPPQVEELLPLWRIPRSAAGSTGSAARPSLGRGLAEEAAPRGWPYGSRGRSILHPWRRRCPACRRKSGGRPTACRRSSRAGGFGVVLLVLGFLVLGAGTEWIFASVTRAPRERILSLRWTLSPIGYAPSGCACLRPCPCGDLRRRQHRRISRLRLAAAAEAHRARLFDRGVLILRFALVAGPIPACAVAGRRESGRALPGHSDDRRNGAVLVSASGTVRRLDRVRTGHRQRRAGPRILARGAPSGCLHVGARTSGHRGRGRLEMAGRPRRRNRRRRKVACDLMLSGMAAVGLLPAGLGIVGGGPHRPVLAGRRCLALPWAIGVTKLSSRHLLRPAVEGDGASDHDLRAVYLDRGLRALLVVGAAFFLAYGWQIDLVELTSRDTLLDRLVRGALSSIVILLVADLIWQVMKTQIDRRLASARRDVPRQRGGLAAGAAAHAAADLPQHLPSWSWPRRGRADGAVGARRGDRAADRRRRRRRRRRRLRGADARQGRHQRHLLPARRRLPGRRVHPERQLQGHGRVVLACARSSSGTIAARSSRCRSASSARSRT